MVQELKVGSKMPPFSLKDHQGYAVTDQDIIGSCIVLFFYPKDDTPGCTEQVCLLRDNMNQFDVRQVIIIGISPDSVGSHQKFIQKNTLKFTLLSDEKKEMARIYGVLNEKNKIIRATFIINSRGVIKWMEKPVTLKGHVERVLEAVDKHCKDEVIKIDDFKRDYADFLENKLEKDENRKKIEKELRKKFGIKRKD